MNDQRPTRWPWSADSSRKAGSPGASARSFRNAETGVSQSSMKLWRSAIRLWSRESSRARSRLGSSAGAGAGTSRAGCAADALGSPWSSPAARGTTAIEHPLGVQERASAAAQEHEQVVDDVLRLFIDALV